MQCQYCGNENNSYFAKINEKFYCRKCIKYKRNVFLENNDINVRNPKYELGFSLTENQIKCSDELLDESKINDCVVYAACGAGKTEIVLETIKENLDKGFKVGIAIPRRQVVLELANRLRKYFNNLLVVEVCEGYTDQIMGDLIICTTHQLFRYHNYFDILIIDEPDAFPFKNDELLHNFAKRSCKGKLIYLTATPEGELLNKKMITLFRRPHNHDLPVPKSIITIKALMIYHISIWIKTHSCSLIFVPTIRHAKLYSKILNLPFVCSKTENRNVVINNMLEKNIKHLITTTILERGVTFKGVDVLVVHADHKVFDTASLIQIAGRVGRDVKQPTGEVLFLSLRKSGVVRDSIQTIMKMNA